VAKQDVSLHLAPPGSNPLARTPDLGELVTRFIGDGSLRRLLQINQLDTEDVLEEELDVFRAADSRKLFDERTEVVTTALLSPLLKREWGLALPFARGHSVTRQRAFEMRVDLVQRPMVTSRLMPALAAPRSRFAGR
jgi:hypothetical protein